MERTKLDAKWDGVTVPTTLEEYCFSSRQQQIEAKSRQESEEAIFMDGDDDYCFGGDDEEFDETESNGPTEVNECEDEGVACNPVSDNSSSKGAVINISTKTSTDPSSSPKSFKS